MTCLSRKASRKSRGRYSDNSNMRLVAAKLCLPGPPSRSLMKHGVTHDEHSLAALSQMHDHGTPSVKTSAELVQYALEHGMLKKLT